MSFRDQLKPTSTKVLKKVVEEEEALLPSGMGGEFLKLAVGLNKVRIYPKHPGEEKYSHIKSSCWLGVEGDDGKEARRTFQNARIHLGVKNDIVEEYIIAAKNKLSKSKDNEDTKKLTDMTKYKEGSNAALGYGTTWLVYADLHVKGKDPQFGLLELKKSVRDALNRESIIEDEEEAIETDPFTDPDEGLPVLITYDNKAKQASNYYKVQVSKNPIALTDEQIEHFEKCKPLSQLSQVNYTLVDFERVLEGLRNYDDTFEIGVFEEDFFQEIVEKCREQVVEAIANKDDDTDEDEKSKKKSTMKEEPKKSSKKVVVEEEEEEIEGDKFDKMDREELKRYNKEKEYGISIIKNKTSDDDIREAIRTKEAEANEEIEDDDDDVVVEAEVETKKKPSLADLKKKLLKK